MENQNSFKPATFRDTVDQLVGMYGPEAVVQKVADSLWRESDKQDMPQDRVEARRKAAKIARQAAKRIYVAMYGV